MREIKFRVWDKDFSKMHIVGTDSHDSLQVFDGVVRYYNYQNGCGSLPDGTGTYDLMQYTGLKDKNGKEIYEGDIVKGKNRLYENQVMSQKVVFLNSCFMLGVWNAHEYFNRYQEIEVIGNIYENPELLES